ncbi:hypothetical protein ACFW03_22120 [Peribacillus butanolivorans]
MKKRLIKKEWEAHIQDFKKSGLSKSCLVSKTELAGSSAILLAQEIITSS